MTMLSSVSFHFPYVSPLLLSSAIDLWGEGGKEENLNAKGAMRLFVMNSLIKLALFLKLKD